jgi:hypothetical protein
MAAAGAIVSTTLLEVLISSLDKETRGYEGQNISEPQRYSEK